jgi:hypothetical protein
MTYGATVDHRSDSKSTTGEFQEFVIRQRRTHNEVDVVDKSSLSWEACRKQAAVKDCWYRERRYIEVDFIKNSDFHLSKLKVSEIGIHEDSSVEKIIQVEDMHVVEFEAQAIAYNRNEFEIDGSTTGSHIVSLR